jgi:hypothetical protein
VLAGKAGVSGEEDLLDQDLAALVDVIHVDLVVPLRLQFEVDLDVVIVFLVRVLDPADVVANGDMFRIDPFFNVRLFISSSSNTTLPFTWMDRTVGFRSP